MIMIMMFRLKLLLNKVGFKNTYVPLVQNNIHDLLVMFEKQDIPAKLQKEEIETLNTKVTESHSTLSLNHKVIVT